MAAERVTVLGKHMETRISVSDKMKEDFKKCPYEQGKEEEMSCVSCSWNELDEVKGEYACCLPEVRAALGGEYEKERT